MSTCAKTHGSAEPQAVFIHVPHYHGEYPELEQLVALATATETIALTATDFVATTEQFVRFVRCDELRRIIEREVEQMATHPGYSPFGSRSENLFIADGDRFVLSAVVISPARVDKDKLFGLPASCLYGNPTDTSIRLRVHKIPDECRLEHFDEKMSLECPRDIEIRPGNFIMLDACVDVPEYSFARAPLLLKLSFKQEVPLVWIYHRATGRPLMCSSSSLIASRLQMVAQVLGEIVDDSSGPPDPVLNTLSTLLDNPHHFVRWSALQAICKIDFDYGAPLLQRARADCHLQVRTAAAQAVDRARRAGYRFEEV